MTFNKYNPIIKWIHNRKSIKTAKTNYTYFSFQGYTSGDIQSLTKILDKIELPWSYTIITQTQSENQSKQILKDEMNRINYVKDENSSKTGSLRYLFKNFIDSFKDQNKKLENQNIVNNLELAIEDGKEKLIEFATVLRVSNISKEEIELIEIEAEDSRIRFYVANSFQDALHNFYVKGTIADCYKYHTNSSTLMNQSPFFGTSPLMTNHSVFAGITTSGVPYFFDLDLKPAKSNHLASIGKTRNGKSAWTKQSIYQACKKGYKIIIIDPQGEYKALTDKLGGVDVEMSDSKGVNIFDFARYTDMQVMSSILVILLENVSNSTLDEYQKAELTNICHLVKKQNGDTYQNFLTALYKSKNLSMYVNAIRNTPITRLLNDKNNTFDLSNQVIRFSFKELSDAELQIFLMVISQLLGGMMSDINVPTIVVIDEGFKILSNGKNKNTIISWLRQLAKFNTSVWLLDQSIREYGELGKTIFENTQYHIFFNHQPTDTIPLSEETYARVSKLPPYNFLFHTNEEQIFLESKIADNLIEYV